jgi:alpha-mannosidase
VEPYGTDASVVAGSDLGQVALLARTDLLEQPREHTDLERLHGYEIATVTARLNIARVGTGAGTAALAPAAEAAQPLYARYWLHNRGPAPLGGLPAVAHLHPDRLTAEPGAELELGLTAASDSTDAALRGSVALLCPAGWSVRPGTLPVQLSPGGHVGTDVVVKVPPDAEPGLYPIRAQLSITGDDVPPAWRQLVEDVAVVSVADQSEEARLLYLVGDPVDIELPAGDAARLRVTIGTDAHADLAVEAHLISPWGTWEWMGPAALGAVLPAGGTVELGFDVHPPVWVEPGTWWALIRVGCAGALVYSPTVQVTVS